MVERWLGLRSLIVRALLDFRVEHLEHEVALVVRADENIFDSVCHEREHLDLATRYELLLIKL